MSMENFLILKIKILYLNFLTKNDIEFLVIFPKTFTRVSVNPIALL